MSSLSRNTVKEEEIKWPLKGHTFHSLHIRLLWISLTFSVLI